MAASCRIWATQEEVGGPMCGVLKQRWIPGWRAGKDPSDSQPQAWSIRGDIRHQNASLSNWSGKESCQKAPRVVSKRFLIFFICL